MPWYCCTRFTHLQQCDMLLAFMTSVQRSSFASSRRHPQPEKPESCHQHNCGTPIADTSQEADQSHMDATCSECIICWEAAPNVVLQPCGHVCVC